MRPPFSIACCALRSRLRKTWRSWSARAREHLADDVRDALGLLARHVEEAPVLLDALARREQVERVLDGLERVVDLVRDGGREAPDGRQLLRLEELLLDAAALELAYL